MAVRYSDLDIILVLLYFRVETLEAAYSEKEKQLSEEKSKFIKLKEDFKYNLKILTERDQELERYDKIFVGKISLKPSPPPKKKPKKTKKNPKFR